MISASALERIEKCPASVSLPRVNETSEAAEAGTAKHDYCADMVEGIARPPPDAESERVWQALKPHVEGMRAERALVINTRDGSVRHVGYRIGRKYGRVEPWEIPVTLDFSRAGALVELKTGHGWVEPPATNLQILTQAYALSRCGSEAVTATLLIVAEGKDPVVLRHEFLPFDWPDILERLQSIVRRVEWARREFEAGRRPPLTIGDHCTYCPARYECPARTSLIRAAVGEHVTGITLENAAEAWRKIAAIESVVKDAKSQIYALAASTPGGIRLGDGDVLGYTEVAGKEEVDAKVAWDVLCRWFGADVARTAVSFSTTKTALRDVMSAMFLQYGNDDRWGSKTNAAEWLLQEIRRRGGISRGETKRVVKVYREGA